jgi:hypothetical protein
MFLLPCWTVAAAPSIRGVSGPALPVHFVEPLDTLNITFGSQWTRGVYPVDFNYVAPRRISDLAAALKKEFPSAPQFSVAGPNQPPTRIYTWKRTSNSIVQTITIWQPGIRTTPEQDRKWGTHWASLGEVAISEHPVPVGATPTTWYAKAIAPIPPAPLPGIPWMKGVTANEIHIASLDWLEGNNAGNLAARDASVASLVVNRPYDKVLKEAATWLTSHSFTRYGIATYFKAQSGLFEVRITRQQATGSNATVITLCSSKRTPTQPILWERA